MIAEVIVDVLNSNVDRIFDYVVPAALEERVRPGSRVRVAFAGRSVEGIAVSLKERSELSADKLKPVLAALDDGPVLSEEFLQLMRYLSAHNYMLLANILRLFIPSEMRGGRVHDKVAGFVKLADEAALSQIVWKGNAKSQLALIDYLREYDGAWVKKSEVTDAFSPSTLAALVRKGAVAERSQRVARTPYQSVRAGEKPDRTLTPDQQRVTSVVKAALGGKAQFLLHGVTGSGKTEVYLSCISACLAAGKTAILLVPEIALTPQMLQVFRTRYGEEVAILHSGLSAGERYDEWWRLKNGEAHIAIGARSAVFAPLENLGIVIIDEEHEQSYIADGSKFVTREVAEFRCQYHNCVLLLGSATPSVESYYRARDGAYTLLELPQRVNRKPMPRVKIVDMREEMRAGNSGIFSAELRAQLDTCMRDGNQAMLFINRRGYASIVMCKECGYVAKCDDCDVTLTYHRDENVLKCHYCDKRFKMLDVCPNCGSRYIKQGGLGTERVAAELAQMYPGVRVLRMDNDTTRTKESHLQIVRSFSERQADILVGTQMIAKGHDFKDVALVGILDADLSLYFSDYRSAERTFQLITQVSGRAGRADVEGSVVLQTYSPGHYIFRLATKNDYRGFYEREIALREATHYPPFAKIVRIVVTGEDEEAALEVLKHVWAAVSELREKYPKAFLYLNKMRAPLKRLQRKYRFQVLARLQCGETANRVTDLLHTVASESRTAKVAAYLEIDPNNMN